MSKIKKVLTEDRGDAKYFFKAVSVALDDVYKIFEEIEGQTKYHTDEQYRKYLDHVKVSIKNLESDFEKLIEVMAKK